MNSPEVFREISLTRWHLPRLLVRYADRPIATPFRHLNWCPKNQKPPDPRKAAGPRRILDVFGSVFVASNGAHSGAEKRRKVPVLVPYQVPLNDPSR
jgi:hypothetical protein